MLQVVHLHTNYSAIDHRTVPRDVDLDGQRSWREREDADGMRIGNAQM